MMDDSHISTEIQLLKEKIVELGTVQEDGLVGVEFGVLYEATVDIFEAINGTLRAAKKQKVVDFQVPSSLCIVFIF
jgi:hypothetical protein